MNNIGLIILVCLVFFSCQSDRSGENNRDQNTPEQIEEVNNIDHSNKNDAGHEAPSAPLDMSTRLQPIKANFKQLNSIKDWTKIDRKELLESTEGGELVLYYQGPNLAKIVVFQYRETGKRIQEFYLLNSQLSFVFEQNYQYNRPIYWDSTTMQELNDDQVFDIKKSEINEKRSYFEDEKLIHQINDQQEAEGDLQEEQSRILERYNELLKK